jgi:uncharacterized protein with ParB-like and HNH nuclease domain
MPFQINPHVQNLSALLAIPNEQFVIPSYQRRYSWQKKQVNALFQDINSLSTLELDNDGHFFGMLLLHSNNHTIFNKLEVVDGQQRLTTITLLLKSIQKAFRQIGDNARVNNINLYLKSNNIQENTTPNKLILGNLDAIDYSIIMNEGEIEEIKNIKLKDAIILFDELVGNLVTNNEIESFWIKLMNIAVIIRLDVGTVKDAYKLFETINNRGLKLSATDIIKNLLFGHASKMNNGEHLEEVKNIWSDIVASLDGVNGNNPDIFFRRYFCSILRRKITANGLIQEFKTYYYKNVQGASMLALFNDTLRATDDEDEDEENNAGEEQLTVNDQLNQISILDFIKKIKKASIEYNKLYFARYNENSLIREIKSLNRIQCEPSYIFLMQFMQLNYTVNNKIIIIKMLASLMLRRHICKKQTGETDQIFSTLVRAIENADQPELMIQTMKDIILNNDYYPNDEEFLTHLLKYEFKGKAENRARALLLEYYNSTYGNQLNELQIANADEVHLEHIIPQTITGQAALREYGNWQEYLGENALSKHKIYVSRIGNLTLLSSKLNIIISNNPFEDKKVGYAISNIAMTNSLTNYAEFKFEQVEERSLPISEVVVQHWRID